MESTAYSKHSEFVEYLRYLIANQLPMNASSINENVLTYSTFAEASFAYKWGHSNFIQTKYQMEEFKENLYRYRSDDYELLRTCLAIYEWGGVQRNIGQLNQIMKNESLGNYLEKIKRELSYVSWDNIEQKINLFSKSPGHLKIDSALTKIYSLMMPHFIIYDGRVGSAWCLLYRLHKLNSGPVDFSKEPFAWGNSTSTSTNKRSPSVGIKGSESFRILAKKKKNDDPIRRHIECNLFANLIIKEVFDDKLTLKNYTEQLRGLFGIESVVETSPFAMHVFETALFMIGNDLSGLIPTD